VWVFELLPRQGSLVTEDGNITETAVFLKVCNPGDVSSQDLSNVFVTQMRKRGIVIRRFHNDLVGAQAAHLVVDTFRPALFIPFNSIKGAQVRRYADLPTADAIPVRVNRLRGEGFLTGA
jgi:hypothetical protein